MNDVNEILKDKQLNMHDELSETTEVTNTETDEAKSKKKAKKEKIITGTVTNCKVLNVRKSPSIESEVIGVVYEGDKLKLDIVKSTNDFYRIISPNGNYGYSMRDYIERD